MILIADGGSTKTDWIGLKDNEIVLKTQTVGLNPSVLSNEELVNIIINTEEFDSIKEHVSEIFFYGAGCGTPKSVTKIQNILQDFFVNANIKIAEDSLAAVYATTGDNPAIVCILGTGSNSCYFNGESIEEISPSLGYTIMDEASGNYFGKILLRDFYYKKMPKYISENFEVDFNLNPDFVKENLYLKPKPNMYLASFAKFMLEFKDEEYIKKIIKEGFDKFFEYRILPYNKPTETPIYFVGSIAFYFKDILESVAKKYNLTITNVIKRPINKLIDYHISIK
ncbi:MAG: N-acetylglucosamine kinase [Tenacibaculum sp.]|nr:N-acetylglucosamine kinase [Tenacibaculum sp.]